MSITYFGYGVGTSIDKIIKFYDTFDEAKKAVNFLLKSFGELSIYTNCIDCGAGYYNFGKKYTYKYRG